MKFRKKPVVIDAELITRTNVKEIAAWCGGRAFGGSPTRAEPFIEIPTLEGVMRADLGDYVIKGVAGEFYPCKPAIFKQTYEGIV